MAFIKGFRASNGLLTGEVWDFATIDITSLSWNTAPGNDNRGFCSIGSGYMGGVDGSGLGVQFSVPGINYNGWGNYFLLASFEIQGYSGSDYKRELRLVTDGAFTQFGPSTYTGNVRVSAFIRSYSDPVTYTDQLITAATSTDVQFHRGDFSNVYAMTVYCSFANAIYNNSHKVLIGISLQQSQGLDIKWLSAYTYFDYNYFWGLIDGNIPEEEFDPDFGPAAEEGGYGADPGTGGGSGGPGPTFDDTSDPWVPSGMPPGISNLGFLNIYKCDANSLVNLGGELFPEITWPTSLSDVGEVLAAVSDSIWNSKLVDFVISIHMIPVDVPAGNLEDIKLGARTMTGILARKVSSDYVEVDCGSLHVDEYYTSFADYMTRCRLFLPFYGFIDIKPEYWQSATLNVVYRFNIVDGTFIARVTSTVTRHQKTFTAMIGQYSGSACIHLPASGASYASIFSGVVSNAGGAAASMATGNVAAAGTSIMNTAAAMGSGGEANYSNPYNASGSIMGHRVPFLLIERPVSHFSENYAVEKGIPLLVRKTIGSCRGFTIAEDAILDGIPATLEEKERIKQYLQSGVIIK